MESLALNNFKDVHECIVESIVPNSACPICGHKMDVSICIDLEADRPLQFSWMCVFCQTGQPLAQRVLSLMVTGSSRQEKLANILHIANSLVKYTKNQSVSKFSALSKLMQIVSSQGICLSYIDFSITPTVRGVYFSHDGVPYIMLDKSLNTNLNEHVAVLAEELGRHFARNGLVFFQSEDEAEEAEEVLALRWAIKTLSSISYGLYDRAS